MFVKLDDETILDMSNGTCYRIITFSNGTPPELHITFNGTQTDKFCSGDIAYGLWNWLNNAAMKFEKE